MSTKPKLYYLNGRGRMESIRWLLAAADVEFEEEFLETREQYEQLLRDGFLLFEQLPLVEIDGMRLVQTKAILHYIAGKYNLYGKDLKERAYIDMYVEGTSELMALILSSIFLPEPDKAKQLELAKQRAMKRYFPVFENVLEDQDYLVGNQLSWADIQLLEAILMVEEVHDDVLPHFPLLQTFKERTSKIPSIKKFLEPGSQKKPVATDKYISTVREVFQF
ncbi:glutathione S-transferase 3-like [Spea bombifrons]|uniref:glutathione S-transferase 3-like n=1 Tax=Spea bombifrons TaxID=233779 RepID=UPI00234A0ED8|nr:glutathione S-transferase 3-like [Spea bombifrons]XP_053315666.1 glutathione S-transferase 3-like [Spea bombifrons]